MRKWITKKQTEEGLAAGTGSAYTESTNRKETNVYIEPSTYHVADDLGVPHNVIRPEQGTVLGLHFGIRAPDRRGWGVKSLHATKLRIKKPVYNLSYSSSAMMRFNA